MSLLQVYIEKNQDKQWFLNYSTLGKGANGRMFEYTNTNFRTQNSFISQFEKFLEIENKDRQTWLKQENHGQEKDKHRVVNMLQSKLFKKGITGLYERTIKGLLYSEFIKEGIPEADKWLINYIFLLNGYYLNQKNYILFRVREGLLGSLLSIDGITLDLLINYARDMLKEDSLTMALKSPFFFIHSFYNDPDFLTVYLQASTSERDKLVEYINTNIKTDKFECCISKKYQPNGNFNLSMLQDETRVFLLTLLFIQSKDVNLDNVYDVITQNFIRNISSIDEKAVLGYLHENKNVFIPILSEILEVEEIDSMVSDSELIGEIVPIVDLEAGDVAEEYIDETSEEGKQRINNIYNIKKRQARIQSDYRCALETINNCTAIYFTAKVTGKNYLELHHLIPREFRNDFPVSIEVLANYVTLCPRCHRQIHLATDRERKHLLNALYDARKTRLRTVGLPLELNEIYEYYRIEA